MWGRGARILTEINRLTQLLPPSNGEISARISAGNRHFPACFALHTGQQFANPLLPLYLDVFSP